MKYQRTFRVKVGLFLLINGLLFASTLAAAPSGGWRNWSSDRSVLWGLHVSGDRAYALEYMSAGTAGEQRGETGQRPGDTNHQPSEFYLNVLSLANPDQPVLLGRAPLPRQGEAVYVNAGRAFVTFAESGFNSGKGGVAVYDVREPAAIKLAYEIPLAEIEPLIQPQITYVTIHKVGDRLYFQGSRGYAIYDDRDPTKPPRLLKTYATETNDLTVAGTTLYRVARGPNNSSMVILEDVRDATRSKKLGEVLLPDLCCVSVALRGRYLYGNDVEMQRLVVIDVQDPTRPRVVAAEASAGYAGLIAPADEADGAFYARSGWKTFLIARFDFQKPGDSILKEVRKIDFDAEFGQFAVYRQRLYVLSYRVGLVVFPLKD